jgi:hypothetical protein
VNLFCTPGDDQLTPFNFLPGPPMVAPNGSVYLQVETTDEIFDGAECNAPAKFIWENTLRLLEIRPEGTTEWRELHHARFEDPTEDFRALANGSVGEVIPDGAGGVLAAWTYSESWPEHTVEARVSRLAGTGGQEYTLPLPGWGHWRWRLEAQEFGEWPNKSLVLGEEGVAFGARLHWRFSEAIGTANIVAFEVATGAVRWTWQAPAFGLEMVAATAGNGLVAKVQGSDGVLRLARFDSTGQVTFDEWLGDATDPIDSSTLTDLQYAWGSQWLAIRQSPNPGIHPVAISAAVIPSPRNI